MDNRYFSDKVVEWYFRHKRDLPWRDTNDPYKVWLSEVILQQTRVNQGLPYYQRFIDRFPTVYDLASGTEQEVLRLWQGLGYYTRGRNLHKCAKTVVSIYKGVFPDNYEKLLELPGVGEYTAAAIASFSFKKPVAVVDGNVFRVLSRVFGIADEINSPTGKSVFAALAANLLNKSRPDHHNQAIMEFGALQCIPRNPLCSGCVLNTICYAAANSLQTALPKKVKAKPSRRRYLYYIVVQSRNSLLMRKRSGKDIWKGLYDFHSIENESPISKKAILKKIRESLGDDVTEGDLAVSTDYKHILSHQVIMARFVLIKRRNLQRPEDKNLKFYTFEKINDLPKPVLITRFLSEYKTFIVD
jgi:A/G-specific adenine glycosylase